MEGDEDMPPFWLQTTDDHRGRRLRRQASSIFLNSGVILLSLLVIAFVFVFIIVPSVVSFTSQIFKPNLIKKSWDSLNLVLVLFAIVCGFLSRNSNSGNHGSYQRSSSSSSSNVQEDDQRLSYPSTPSHKWNDHPHQNQYQDRTMTANYGSLNRLRSFSSYPDLRQESLWLNSDERWRFYDDTYVSSHKYSSSSHHELQDDRPFQQKQHQEQDQMQKSNNQQQEVAGIKDIAVDTFVTHQNQVVHKPPPSPPTRPPSSPPPPPESPPKQPTKSTAVRRKVKRTYHDNAGVHEKRREDKDLEVKNFKLPPPSAPLPPPPPPPPPPPIISSKNDKRRGKDLLTSLRRKKKKQRQKSVENLESLFEPQYSLSLIPPPSPPPPPPPPHFLRNLFASKKTKTKKDHPTVPPPPPPPPSSLMHASRISAQEAAITSYKPPKAVKAGHFSSVEENAESGSLSPSIPLPPPPPPPFKMQSWKFIREGDYVRVASFNSSRSGSPDLDSEDPSDKESSPMARKDGQDSTMPSMFCPSPDVNTKAENFIARFRANLKLEKVNSVKGRSNLGPDPDAVEGEGTS